MRKKYLREDEGEEAMIRLYCMKKYFQLILTTIAMITSHRHGLIIHSCVLIDCYVHSIYFYIWLYDFWTIRILFSFSIVYKNQWKLLWFPQEKHSFFSKSVNSGSDLSRLCLTIHPSTVKCGHYEHSLYCLQISSLSVY